MAQQKRKHSNARSNKRRSHDFLTLKSLSICTNCDARIIPHRICPSCGFYKGRQVITLSAKKEEK